MQIKKVGIIGLGALGGYFAAGLSDKLKENFIVIAENERKQRLKTSGIIINDKKYNLNVQSPNEVSEIDLLIITLKYTALNFSLDMIEKSINKNTVIMCPMNGIDTEDIIAKRIGEKQIIYSLARISSERIGNSIKFDAKTTPGVYFGEKGIREKTERIKAIEELFKGTIINYHFMEDIIQDMWEKFALNVSNNLPQAIIGCPMGAYTDSVYAKNLLVGLRNEVVEIAKAQGIQIQKDFDFTFKGSIEKSARYSTLQDIDAKRPTEIDAFAGVMIKLGKKYNIQTPYSEFAYNAIKAIEEKNEGKFDY